jgi:hypothetical protein
MGKLRMLKSISFKKLAVLSAGVAIVLSSCGLQNEASDSSGTETAAGKTKNYALTVTGACIDSIDSYAAVSSALNEKWHKLGWGEGHVADFDAISPAGWATGSADWDTFWADIQNGEVCPVGGIESLGIEEQSSSGSGSSARVCVKSEIKQALLEGYQSQLDRPLGGEVTEEYIAKMQKGYDVTNGMCTN